MKIQWGNSVILYCTQVNAQLQAAGIIVDIQVLDNIAIYDCGDYQLRVVPS